MDEKQVEKRKRQDEELRRVMKEHDRKLETDEEYRKETEAFQKKLRILVDDEDED